MANFQIDGIMLLITSVCFLQLISLIRLGRNFCDEEIKQSSDFKSFVKDFLKKSILDTIRIHNALLTRATPRRSAYWELKVH